VQRKERPEKSRAVVRGNGETVNTAINGVYLGLPLAIGKGQLEKRQSIKRPPKKRETN